MPDALSDLDVHFARNAHVLEVALATDANGVNAASHGVGARRFAD